MPLSAVSECSEISAKYFPEGAKMPRAGTKGFQAEYPLILNTLRKQHSIPSALILEVLAL